MQSRQDLNREMQQRIEKQNIEAQKREMNPWTSKAKKNTVVTFEVNGKKTSLPIAAYLKRESLKLPPMKQNGKSVVHFNELMWLFMHGKTKSESQKAVDDYCTEIVKIWNKAVEEAKKTKDDEDHH